jgi:hypothetical protein
VAALVTIGSESIMIQLSGLNAIATRRRRVEIPLAAITAIRAIGELPDRRLSSISAPLTGTRSGVLECDGVSVLLVCRPGQPTITLDLDRATYPEIGFDRVVLSADRSEIPALGAVSAQRT